MIDVCSGKALTSRARPSSTYFVALPNGQTVPGRRHGLEPFMPSNSIGPALTDLTPSAWMVSWTRPQLFPNS